MTSQDLGGSIDSFYLKDAEELVQDDAKQVDGPPKDPGLEDLGKLVDAAKSEGHPKADPEPVVDSSNDHTDSIVDTPVSSSADDSAEAHGPMLADADPEFQRQQRKDGVQMMQ